MDNENTPLCPHPQGETNLTPSEGPRQLVPIDTAGGRVHVQWDDDSPVTPMGQFVFFVHFLAAGGLLEEFFQGAPLNYESRNSPKVIDVLGTAILSILAGHRRYAHINGLRFDTINPPLLGMTGVVSEDCVRRGIGRMDEDEALKWLGGQMKRCWGPLLEKEWILDVDTMIKTVYGKGEGMEVSYNPHKPGRPSHVYHTYFIAGIRICLGTDVERGSKHAPKYGMPYLWKWLDDLPKERWPTLIRADCAYGNESILCEAEKRKLPYLFRLKQTPNVKKLVVKLEQEGQWEGLPDSPWEAIESKLRLHGWSRTRRVVILRRPTRAKRPTSKKQRKDELALEGESIVTGPVYDYVVLVTPLDMELHSIGQLYRDRADAENVFDELKNQWGWGGFTTHDLKRCRIMSMLIALIYNWWSLYTRLVDDRQHHEAITSRPAMLNAVARQTEHAGQRKIRVSLLHSSSERIKELIEDSSHFIFRVLEIAEQFSAPDRWRLILTRIFRRYLNGTYLIEPPPELEEALALPT